MNKKSNIGSSKFGFAVIGIAVTLAILGAMAAALLELVASNQSTRIAQQSYNQAFYIAHAGLEHAMRQIKVNGATTVPTRQILGANLGSSRGSCRIADATSFGFSNFTASDAFSVLDPVTNACQLSPDTSNLINHAHKTLQGMILNNISHLSISVVSIKISWPGYLSSNLSNVKIGGNSLWSGTAGSGSTLTLSSAVTLASRGSAPVDGIQWDNMPQNTPIAIAFNMSDGSSMTTTVSVP